MSEAREGRDRNGEPAQPRIVFVDRKGSGLAPFSAGRRPLAFPLNLVSRFVACLSSLSTSFPSNHHSVYFSFIESQGYEHQLEHPASSSVSPQQSSR